MTRALTVLEKVRFRLRDVEHTELPTPLRQALIKTLPDPYEGRSASLKGGREIIFLRVPKTDGTSVSHFSKRVTETAQQLETDVSINAEETK